MNLCCQLNPEWRCYACGWQICRLHWTRDARKIHKNHRKNGCAHNIDYVYNTHWARTITGRISCSKPNLSNVPKNV